MISRLVLLGPPGAGKGTQARFISEHLGVPAVSTGEIFRRNIADDTPLGRQAKQYMDRGEFVPDEVTNAMVAEYLASDELADGFLLDGYPRSLEQAKTLEKMLSDLGVGLDCVVEISVDEDALVKRLLARAEVEGRADDTEPIIRRRMEVYHQQTQPVSNFYVDRDQLIAVDGSGSIEEVWELIKAALS